MLRKYEQDGLTTRMARFVCQASYRDLPEGIRDYVKVMTADALACGFGAAVLPSARIFAESAKLMGAAQDAVILSTGVPVSTAAAAYANAWLMNALDADDTFYTSGHPLAPIFASALAVAEEVGASGEELIAAIAVGYDVAIRCKRAILGNTPGSMGWFVMGAVAAAARLYRLDELQTAMSFGIAAMSAPHQTARWNQMASGRRHDMKYWAVQNTAFAAVTAAQLARAGFTGDRTIFDGEPNFSHFIGFNGIDEALMFEDLGTRWWIGETSVKPWAVCRYSQVSITLIREILAEQGLSGAEVEGVDIQTSAFVAGPWFTAPMEITSEFDAQFSFTHSVAATLLGWDLGPDWQARAIGDGELAAWAKRVRIVENPNYDRDSIITDVGNKYVATVVVLRAGGREYRKEGGYAQGDPFEERYRMTLERIREKYFAYAAKALSPDRVAETFANIEGLERLPTVRRMLSI